MQIPKQVLVTDVVARDGFQNEERHVSTEDKLRVIEGLVRAGVSSIEVTSFVHSGVVPQLADAAEVVARQRRDRREAPCVWPNPMHQICHVARQ